MGTFLSVILFIILGFYLLGAILRLLLRVWLARKAKEFQEKGFTGSTFTGSFGGFRKPNDNAEQEKQKEGEIKISKAEPENRKINEKVGEYVDFDEVK